MMFFSRLFSLRPSGGSGSTGTADSKKSGTKGIPAQHSVERSALGHSKFEVPIQILVDYRASYSPSACSRRTDTDARSPWARGAFPAGLTYPDDLYGNAVLSLDYSPMSSPSPVSVYSHCEADDEFSFSGSHPSESGSEFDFDPSGYEYMSTGRFSESSYDSDSDSSFANPCTVTIPANVTIDDIERRLQDVQIRLLRSCQDQSERDKLFRYVVLGIYGKDCDHDGPDEELMSEAEDADGVAWVIHAPKPTHVVGFEYEWD
ncbi:hypothetical protein FA13DRAFT_1742931 [Coprinellus micaceus]|uniref:Uncharacterized protein n=1 Tax=Coprinellus micaceus TaxID=71717 RepID=A0A4Y7SH34_COPMI|nr:hypothetical protein FA13DRAFT_1742931 [Coprinellus micaceus]